MDKKVIIVLILIIVAAVLAFTGNSYYDSGVNILGYILIYSPLMLVLLSVSFLIRGLYLKGDDKSKKSIIIAIMTFILAIIIFLVPVILVYLLWFWFEVLNF